MTITYIEATKEDLHQLNEFRWQRAYKDYALIRKDKRGFKKDFLFFLNDKLNEEAYHCYFAENEKDIQATIYWCTEIDEVPYDDAKPEKSGYIQYMERSPNVSDEVMDHLLDHVIEIAKKQDWNCIMALNADPEETILINHGFTRCHDVYLLKLK